MPFDFLGSRLVLCWQPSCLYEWGVALLGMRQFSWLVGFFILPFCAPPGASPDFDRLKDRTLAHDHDKISGFVWLSSYGGPSYMETTTLLVSHPHCLPLFCTHKVQIDRVPHSRPSAAGFILKATMWTDWLESLSLPCGFMTPCTHRSY